MTFYYKELIKTPKYIMGSLSNGKECYDTLALPDAQLPGSIMRITLLTPNDGGPRILALVPEDYDYDAPDANAIGLEQHVGIISWGISYRSQKHPGILVGLKDFPGSLTRSRKIYDRLVDRIEKCLGKPADCREGIHFVKCKSAPIQLDVHPYWLAHPMHGCPPTNIRCEVTPSGDVHVYDGNRLIRTHTLQEQKERYKN